MKKLLVLSLMFMMCLTGYAQTRGDTVYVSNVPQATVNQTTDQVLSKVLQKSLDLAEKTGQFVIDQAPDILREFYMWHTAEHIFWIMFGIMLILVGRYLPYIWCTKDSESYYKNKFFNRYTNETDFSWMIFAGALIIGVFIIINNLYNLIFLLVSPKLYLIEYLLSLQR